MPFFKKIFDKNKIFRDKTVSRIVKRYTAFDIKLHFEDNGYKLHLLDKGPSQTVELTKENGLRYYRQMILIRKMENAAGGLYRKKLVRGFCHLYTGQEAVAVGMNSVLRPQDSVITSYRCHGWAFLVTNDLKSIFGEFLGHVSGVSRGKGGSMHLYGPRFYGGNGIVGAHIPLGVGLALEHKYSGSDGICVAICGDGAASQGQVYESHNIAKLKMLPVIFVVENNYYGMGTEISRSAANPEFYKQSGYIPGIKVNGNHILSVIEATKFAMNHILKGKGPIILEMMTYRFLGHSMSDPGTAYRPRAEIQAVREQKCPLKYLRMLMMKSNLGTEQEFKEIKDATEEEVNQAKQQALECKPPPIEELTADCYATYPDLIRTSKMLTFVPHKHYAKYEKSKQ